MIGVARRMSKMHKAEAGLLWMLLARARKHWALTRSCQLAWGLRYPSQSVIKGVDGTSKQGDVGGRCIR